MPVYDKPSERVFQCSRCRCMFSLEIVADDLPKVCCPRRCPVKVIDITDKVKTLIEKARSDSEKKIAARAIQVVKPK